MTKLIRFVRDDSGATAVEYGIIAVAIGLMLLLVMPLFATALSGLFQQLTAGIEAF